jgi:hypothetical protein
MSKRSATQRTMTMHGPVLPPYVLRALNGLAVADEPPDLETRAVTAWEAEAAHRSEKACRELSRRLKRMLNVDVEPDPLFFDFVNPRDSVGVSVDGRLFGLRSRGRDKTECVAYIAAVCSQKGCRQERAYPIANLVELGLAFAQADEDGSGVDWKCDAHSGRFGK